MIQQGIADGNDPFPAAFSQDLNCPVAPVYMIGFQTDQFGKPDAGGIQDPDYELFGLRLKVQWAASGRNCLAHVGIEQVHFGLPDKTGKSPGQFGGDYFYHRAEGDQFLAEQVPVKGFQGGNLPGNGFGGNSLGFQFSQPGPDEMMADIVDLRIFSIGKPQVVEKLIQVIGVRQYGMGRKAFLKTDIGNKWCCQKVSLAQNKIALTWSKVNALTGKSQ